MMFVRLWMAITLIEVIIAVLEKRDSFGTQSVANKRWTVPIWTWLEPSTQPPFSGQKPAEASRSRARTNVSQLCVCFFVYVPRFFVVAPALGVMKFYELTFIPERERRQHNVIILSTHYHQWGNIYITQMMYFMTSRQTSAQLFSFLLRPWWRTLWDAFSFAPVKRNIST